MFSGLNKVRFFVKKFFGPVAELVSFTEQSKAS